MNSLILDRFNKQPLYLRFFWRILTAIGWSFWIYLWLPLIAPIGIYFGIYHGVSAAEAPWQQLMTTLMSHFSTVCIALSIFLAWALLQRFGRDSKGNDGQKNRFKSTDIIQSSLVKEQSFITKQQVQRVVVYHDEKTGKIMEVANCFK